MYINIYSYAIYINVSHLLCFLNDASVHVMIMSHCYES